MTPIAVPKIRYWGACEHAPKDCACAVQYDNGQHGPTYSSYGTTDEKAQELAEEGRFDSCEAKVVDNHAGPECLIQMSALSRHVGRLRATGASGKAHTFSVWTRCSGVRVSRCVPRPLCLSRRFSEDLMRKSMTELTSMNQNRESNGKHEREYYEDVVSSAYMQQAEASDASQNHEDAGDSDEDC